MMNKNTKNIIAVFGLALVAVASLVSAIIVFPTEVVTSHRGFNATGVFVAVSVILATVSTFFGMWTSKVIKKA